MFQKILLGFTIIIFIFIGFIAFQLVQTKSHSPAQSVEFSNPDISILVDYYAPFKKGRNIFGGLVPYGKYWRTGANNSTEIEFSRDIFFGNEKVRAGRYRLYTIPDEYTWTVVLNTELDQWGLFEPDYNLDVIKVTANPLVLTDVQEQFEIRLEENGAGVDLILAWDQTEAVVILGWERLL